MKPKNSAVVLYSGGLDSTVLLFYAQKQYEHVYAISANYGQRHARELTAATAICHLAKVPHQIADLTDVAHLFAGQSSQMGKAPVPDGHYTATSMACTVVPNRNMILLSIATGWAITQKAEAVLYGAHAGDHAIYADCRPAFIEAMQHAVLQCDENPAALHAPFQELDKADIVRLGHELHAPLSQTWSCYRGGTHHCGTCGTCVERIEAFERCGLDDPTDYVDRAQGLALAERHQGRR